MIKRIIRTAYISRLLANDRYSFVISKLFKKKIDQERVKEHLKAERPKSYLIDQEQLIQEEDQKIDFEERRMEIDTNIDYAKLKSESTHFMPDEIGTGGFDEVLYWSQTVKTFQQVNKIVKAFNSVSVPSKIAEPVHFEQFKQMLIQNIHLAGNFSLLYDYSLFGYKYNIGEAQFWSKIEYKILKIPLRTEDCLQKMIDITLFMSRFEVGEYIYNHVEQILMQKDLKIDQTVKLSLVYFNLKKGKRQWISKLLQSFESQLAQANQEQLTEALPAIKDAKNKSDTLNDKIRARVIEQAANYNYHQIINIADYFGFDQQSVEMWKALEEQCIVFLNKKPMSLYQFKQTINKVLLTYKFSEQFIRQYIIKIIVESNYEILQKLEARTLSSLSKGLYIYQLQGQASTIQTEIQKLIISKITNDINTIEDEDLVQIIKDYNLTRHGNRQLYIFFEEVIKIKYLKNYVADLNRNTVELLISIYEHSGMCSKSMFEQLKSLI